MGTPHIHAEIIKAWADGKQIQWQDSVGTWRNVNEQHPIWCTDTAYRVKPETIRYRVALFKDVDEGWTDSANSQETAVRCTSSRFFVRWLTDWIEVEV